MRSYDRTHRTVFNHQYRLFPTHPMRSMWHCALMCGHAQTLPDWGIGYRGQGFLLQSICRGKGWVTTNDRRFPADAGDLIFLDTHMPYEMEVNPRDPWEHYWVTFDSAIGHHWVEHMDCNRCPIFHPSRPERVLRMFQRLCQFARRKPPGFEGQMSVLIHGIVSDLFTEQAKERARGLDAAAAKARENLRLNSPLAVRKALNFIDNYHHMATSASKMVAESGVGRSRLFALFKKHVGRSPMFLLCDNRIHHARELLRHTNLPIKSISVQIGIEDVNYFSRLFRKKTGVSPRRYRAKSHRRLHLPSATNRTVDGCPNSND
ncbi:MAG: AraC family transcriptional regulator [Verrucomicrobia bacterium]|nr:AraC family transcriptional regulator [Verrucomicrobiota bacterium]